MTRVLRRAPHSEWVEMYRQGLGCAKIAQLVLVAVTTVRYHIRVAAIAEPSLREEHAGKLRTSARVSKAGIANMSAVVSLYASEGRLPSAKPSRTRERVRAAWLLRRRRDAERGRLSPVYRQGLASVPLWDQRSRKAADEARWKDRLRVLVIHMASGNEWPRHKETDSEEERILGVWLHVQRSKSRAGDLAYDKEALLNEALPGWRVGRTRGRRKAPS